MTGSGISPESGDSRGSCAPENEITLAMVDAGVRAYLDWDYDKEEPELLVVSVFSAMSQARSKR